MLLDHGADPNVEEDDRWTPLLRAAQAGNFHLCELLLDHGADATHCSYRETTPLHYLAATVVGEGEEGAHMGTGHFISEELLEVVLLRLLKGGIDVNKQGRSGETALHRACLSGNQRVIRFLLDQPNVELDLVSNSNEAPLHYACRKGDVAVVQMLLAAGATRDLSVNQGPTPSDVAWERNESAICEVVHEEDEVYLRRKLKKVLTEFTFKDIERLLETAERKGIDVCELVNTPVSGNQTPLHCAVVADNLRTSLLLLRNGATVDNLDNNRFAALHLATLSGSLALCHVLIDNCASFTVPVRSSPKLCECVGNMCAMC